METALPVFSKIPEPLPQHYPAVYWFWHHIPSLREIEEQLSEIKQAGYRTFLIQPRLAFPRHEYLGEGYLQAYRLAMQAASKLELTAGLYDDYNWISGHAGGRTVAGHDELRERQLFWSQGSLEQGSAVCSISGIHNRMGDGLGRAFQDWIYEGGQAVWADWQIVRAYLCVPDHPGMDVTAACRVISAGSDGCQVRTDINSPVDNGTRIIIFVSARCITSRLVNMLHPAAASRFIEAGYEPYRRAIGHYFGSTLTFLFIDQPYTGFYTWNEHSGNPLNALMFDESLGEVFREERGYDMGHALLALVREENADTPHLRCDFFETYGRLARSRFLEPLADWAHTNGLKFAGHELLGYVGGWGFADGLSGIDARVNFASDYFAIDEYKDISSVDACNYHPQVSARFGASLAKSHGRKGCIIEQYSVPVGRSFPAPTGQWDLTLSEVRSQAIRHLLYGAGTFLFHAFYQTSGSGDDAQPMSNPRFDFPPGINYEPWFRFHPQFAEELARLNLFLEEIQPQTRIALLYPLRTAWHESPTGSYNAESAFWNRWLTEHGFEYDIIDEQQVDAEGLSSKGYRLLILPGAGVVKDGGFITQVQKFVENGGRLAVSGMLPAATQEKGADAAMQRRFRDWMDRSPRAIRFADSAQAKLDANLPVKIATLQGGITVEPADGRPADRRPADGRPEDGRPASLVTRQGNTLGGSAIAILNDGVEERKFGLFVPAVEGLNVMPERWFPDTGVWQQWAYYEPVDGGIKMSLTLNPAELACFKFKLEKPEDRQPSQQKTRRISQRATHRDTQCISQTDSPRLCRLDGNAIVESADLDENGQLEVTLRCNQKETLHWVVCSREQPKISGAVQMKDIRSLQQNHWQVDMEISSLPEPLVLGEHWTLRTPHQYKAAPADLLQGWEKDQPYYSGSGYYSVNFHLGQDALNYCWELQCPGVHTALSAYLNQVWMGARGWPPYRLLLPVEALKPAYNQLRLAVWNTAGNSFYRNTPYQPEIPFPSGLDKAPELHPFLRVSMILK